MGGIPLHLSTKESLRKTSSRMKVVICLTLLVVAVAAQFPGDYRYNNRDNGQYRPSDDGQYRPDDSGQYRPDDQGQYRPSNDGRYNPNDNQYQNQNQYPDQYQNQYPDQYQNQYPDQYQDRNQYPEYQDPNQYPEQYQNQNQYPEYQEPNQYPEQYQQQDDYACQQEQERYRQEQEQQRYQQEQQQQQYQPQQQQYQSQSPVNYAPSRNYVGIRSQEIAYPKPDGSFKYAFDTEDGTSVSAVGNPSRSSNGRSGAGSAAGQHSHISPEGVRVTTNWVADEQGFHPEVKYDFPRTS